MNSLTQLLWISIVMTFSTQTCAMVNSKYFLETSWNDHKPKLNLACDLLINQTVRNEINSYQDQVDTIIEAFMSGALKGKTFDFLAEMTDTFGPRLTGSEALDNAIDWLLNRGAASGYNKAFTEPVTAPHWVRNNESLYMLSPRVQKFPMLGFGNSVGTPLEGIVANILVVTSFGDLAAKGGLAEGRIVVYNVPFTSYGETVQYRNGGADEASKYGAVASLVRSVTPFSIASPHTGTQSYSGNVPSIPTGAITVEDAQMLQRMQDRGQIVKLHLTMGAQNLGDVITRNTILEVQGSSLPDEVVVVGGHLDSWDVGVGAMDDGAGVAIGFMTGRALKELSLIPTRTLRTVLFTAEEQGIYGGDAYYAAHSDEASQFQIMMESDGSVFYPLGIAFKGTDVATCMMQEIVLLTQSINTSQTVIGGGSSDLGLFGAANVPIGSLYAEPDNYFWYHHSEGDRMEVLDTDSLDKVAALWTSVSWVLSDIGLRLPH